MQTGIADGTTKGIAESNRVYGSIKTMIMEHELPLGKRILVEPLADGLGVSNTPVREVLIHLAAERMIRDVPKAGFFTKEISGMEIQSLYVLNLALLDLSLSYIREAASGPGMMKPPKFCDDAGELCARTPAEYVHILNQVFVHMARQSGNLEILHGVKNVNDRTYYIRLQECQLMPTWKDELKNICGLYDQKDIAGLRQALQEYHDKMITFLPELLLLLRRAQAEAE
ncbi:GntR family transcriptional regulator [Paremcibacter congregatus]|uniref:GntR family transcriptional regulator n=1 Tax=Paremcibacter congregatus TaxID=2043170 RepID=UPI0030ECA383|tara:strand:+ start:2180 stop:2863 length:684 start_codon:yes stop_codon:yes gene_type:complete